MIILKRESITLKIRIGLRNLGSKGIHKEVYQSLRLESEKVSVEKT